MLANISAQIDTYVRGKLWYWYLPLWLFGGYLFFKLLGFNMLAPMPFVLLVPYSFDFMLHELAHIFTAFLPGILTASAGSFSELLLGTLLVIGAFKFRNYFASLFCFLWFMLTCQSAGTYMADAIPQRLPLVSLGGALSGQDAVHDWHFVFGQLHMLGLSGLIGNSVRVIGILAGLFGLIFSAWLMYKMAAAGDKPAVSANEQIMLEVAAAQNKKPKPAISVYRSDPINPEVGQSAPNAAADKPDNRHP